MLWLIQEKSEKDSPQTHHISGNGADGDGKFCFRCRSIVLINNIIHFQSIPARFALEVFPAPQKPAENQRAFFFVLTFVPTFCLRILYFTPNMWCYRESN